MNPLKRWRWWAVLALPLAVIVINSLGPNGWREPVVRLLWLSWTAVAVAVALSASKAMADYAHGRDAWIKALEHPIGAGLAFLALCVLRGAMVVAIVWASMTQFAQAGEVQARQPAGLARAEAMAPMIVDEINAHWPKIPRRSYLGALFEQESCRSLSHSMCWSSTARLKTSREEGGGLAQLTRAWTKTGALRFDSLDEVRRMAPSALEDLDWQSVYERPELSVRAAIIKLRGCDARLQALSPDLDALVRVAFCDAAYNGGWSHLQQDRQLCAMQRGCDADQWFEHVELHSVKSREKWQGYGQSAYDINREHVRNTVPLHSRRMKYLPWLGYSHARSHQVQGLAGRRPGAGRAAGPADLAPARRAARPPETDRGPGPASGGPGRRGPGPGAKALHVRSYPRNTNPRGIRCILPGPPCARRCSAR